MVHGKPDSVFNLFRGGVKTGKGRLSGVLLCEREKTGVDNVCERAAMKAANEEGTFILRKQAENGMTIAIVKYDWKLERELAKEYRIDEQ